MVVAQVNSATDGRAILQIGEDLLSASPYLKAPSTHCVLHLGAEPGKSVLIAPSSFYPGKTLRCELSALAV